MDALPIPHSISRMSYRKMLQNVTLAFLFNGIGIPLAACNEARAVLKAGAKDTRPVQTAKH